MFCFSLLLICKFIDSDCNIVSVRNFREELFVEIRLISKVVIDLGFVEKFGLI